MKKFILLTFVCLLSFIAYGQEDCGGIPNSTAALQDYPIPPNIDDEEALVKVYFHVYRDNAGNGGQTQDRLDQIMTNLNDYFSTTAISFFYNECETRWVNDDFLHASGDRCNFFENNRHLDGVDIHVKGDNTSFTGVASNIPGDEYLMGGQRSDGTPTVLSSTSPHEMGHCLGLFHTHHGTCTEIGEDCLGNTIVGGDATTGDFVDDTPTDARLSSSIVNSSCVWNGTVNCPAPSTISPLTDNIMSYSLHTCRQNFTEGQNARMLALMSPSIIHTTGATGCCGSGSDVHIYSNTTYNTDQEVSGDIIVHTGAQLTVTDATLQFGKDKKIVVEQGAKLLVDNGTLTKCDDAQDWRGIIVEGNSNLAQPNAFSMPSANEAGVVLVINNSRIEWSRTAIATNYYNGWTDQKWGGLVHCENSNFIKNRRAVAFMKYKDFTNQSKFINCTFDGDNFAFGETFGVTIWATDGVTFNQCRFYNMDDSGILTIDGSPIVKGGNDFNDNYYGIYTTATYPYAAFLEVGDDGLDPNYFWSNIVDINANATDQGAGIKIVNNQFFDSFISNLLIGPSKYSIRDNAFAGMVVGLLPVQTGALAYNQHNYIAQNDFNAAIGVYPLGPNRELQVLCNRFQTNYDYPLFEYNGVPGEVRLYQGTYASPAGNCFTNPQLNTDIYTIDPTVSFNYYHETDPACQVPVTPGNYDPIPSPNKSCTDPIWKGLITEGDLNDVKGQIAALEAAGDTRSEKYYALVQAKDYILSSLLDQYLGRDDIKGALRIVSKDSTPFGQLATFGILMDNGMYTDATNFLRGMSINDPEMKEFRNIQNINLARLTSTKAYVLNKSDKTYLESIAKSDLGVRVYARAILLLLTGTTYEDDILSGAGGSKRLKLPSKGNNTKGKTTLTDKATHDQLHSFNVSPNPATDQFAITFDPSQYDKELYVKVLNVNGQVIYDTTIPSDQNQVQVSTMDWNNGLYMLQITDQSGQLIYSSKMLKQ